MNTFTLTAQHVLLLSHMCVRWDDCETGAPAIDPKRPYGNSDVFDDMREILKDEKISDGLLWTLHKETEVALQIVLQSQSFKPGNFVCPEFGKWRRVGP